MIYKRDTFLGASILIVKNGKAFLNKGYGYQDVDKKVKASPTTKYEIASNTKAPQVLQF